MALDFALGGESPDRFAPFEAALIEPGLEDLTSVAVLCDEKAGLWRVRAIVPRRPPAGQLEAGIAAAAAAAGIAPAAFSVEPLAETDWVAAVNRASPAIAEGPFYVRGRHIAATAPAGSHDILLDAGQAFGTGSHETTRGCLRAIAAVPPPRPGSPVLDLGTGSGLLAIAMAKHWGNPVIAADNDAVAVAVATENAAANGVGDLVETLRSQGFANRRLRTAAPYAFIAANILARPLVRMARALAGHIAADGRVVLSGILAGQDDAVLAAYRRHGLVERDRVVLGDWPSLILGPR